MEVYLTSSPGGQYKVNGQRIATMDNYIPVIEDAFSKEYQQR